MQYQSEADRKARRKIIIIAISIVAIILILITAIIVVSTKKPAIESALVNEPTASGTIDEPKTDPKNTPVGQITTESTIQNTTNPVAEVAHTMPTTGPENLIPVALLCGSLTTFIISEFLVKKSA